MQNEKNLRRLWPTISGLLGRLSQPLETHSLPTSSWMRLTLSQRHLGLLQRLSRRQNFRLQTFDGLKPIS